MIKEIYVCVEEKDGIYETKKVKVVPRAEGYNKELKTELKIQKGCLVNLII